MMTEDELERKAQLVLEQLAPSLKRAMEDFNRRDRGGVEETILAGMFYLSVLCGLTPEERRLVERCAEKMADFARAEKAKGVAQA
jgi:hypothetical protein